MWILSLYTKIIIFEETMVSDKQKNAIKLNSAEPMGWIWKISKKKRGTSCDHKTAGKQHVK